MGGESVQLSQAQKRRMEAMSMNMGTRIVCGYLASLLFLGISLYLAVTYPVICRASGAIWHWRLSA